MPQPAFRRLSDLELHALSDEELVEHLARARAAGEVDTTGQAIAMLAYRFLDDVRWRILMRVRGDTDLADELAHDAFVETVETAARRGTDAWQGTGIASFRAWLNVIVARTVADHFRTPTGKMRQQETRLVSEHQDDDELWGKEPATDPLADLPDQLYAWDLVDRALREVDNDMHREVIHMYLFSDIPAAEVAERLDTSENNVHAIASRFRKSLRRLLEADDPGP